MPFGVGLYGDSSVLGNISFLDGVNNAFTGNQDFARQKYFFDQQVAANNATAAADRRFTASQNAATREFNAREAQKARDFEAQQSATQYTRAAAQLRQLGINPAVLAFGGSAGSAAAASGSAASVSGSSGGSHHVTGASWSRSTGALSDLLRLSGSFANSAAIALRAISFLK